MYRHIPEAVYFMEYRRLEEDGHPFLIATAEKAICDSLYHAVALIRSATLLTADEAYVHKANQLGQVMLLIDWKQTPSG